MVVMEGEGARGYSAAGHQPRAAPGPPPRPSPPGHHHLPRPAASSLPLLAPARRPPQRTSYRAPRPLPGRLGGGGDPHYTGARAERWGERGAARRTPLPPRLSSGEKAASATCPGLFRRRLLHLLTPPPRAPPPRRVPLSASRRPACGWGPECARTPSPTARALPRLTLRGSGRVKSASRARRPISGAAATAPSPPPRAPARGQGLRAGPAARAGPEEGSPGASRASPECRGLRASWVALRSPHLPLGAAPALSCTGLQHPTLLEPRPWRHLARLRPVRPPARESRSGPRPRPARLGAGSSGAPRAAALEQRRPGPGLALRSPRPLTHRPFPPPPSHYSPSPCPAVRGARLRGAGSGYPPGHCPPGRGLDRGGLKPGDPRAKPTPRTRAGLQPPSAPALRPAAVRPPPCEAEPPTRAPLGRSSLHHPRAQGSSLPRAGRGEPRGRGPLIPAPPPRAGSGSGPGTGARAAGTGGCGWPSRATAAPRGPPAPQPGSRGSARLAPVGPASRPGRYWAARTDRRAGRATDSRRNPRLGALCFWAPDTSRPALSTRGPAAPARRGRSASSPQRQRKSQIGPDPATPYPPPGSFSPPRPDPAVPRACSPQKAHLEAFNPVTGPSWRGARGAPAPPAPQGPQSSSGAPQINKPPCTPWGSAGMEALTRQRVGFVRGKAPLGSKVLRMLGPQAGLYSEDSLCKASLAVFSVLGQAREELGLHPRAPPSRVQLFVLLRSHSC
ncbi:basic proline-rich protein-like [Choloepus didactylus]|uniref:basic proline-rich protein-like n=1 Tax=Choloepus didactylus TaxID=27675 RepID=UPI00189CFCD6|nr:basic proline-rich protein-like [Choloepus didactylus]